MKKYKIIEYQNSKCHVHEKGWFFWWELQRFDGWNFEPWVFKSRCEAEEFVRGKLLASTVKKVTLHP